MTAALDELLNIDPMDLLQWDEWESISAESFLTSVIDHFASVATSLFAF